MNIAAQDGGEVISLLSCLCVRGMASYVHCPAITHLFIAVALLCVTILNQAKCETLQSRKIKFEVQKEEK